MCRVFAGFMHVFSIVGVVFCEGRNKAMKIWQRVCLKCVSKVLHPLLTAVIHSVLVGPRVHQAAEPSHH